MMDFSREMNRLRSRRWRLNQKYCFLVNDGYLGSSPEIEEILARIDHLDKRISDLRIGIHPTGNTVKEAKDETLE